VKVKWWYLPAALGGAIILICGVLICAIGVKVGAPLASFACHIRADSYYNNGEYEEAVKWFDRAVKLYPQHGLSYFRKAESLVELGKLEEALEVYDEALARYAGDDFIYLVYDGKAEALAELGKWEEAVETYGQAIYHGPEYRVKNPLLEGIICLKGERYAEAIAYFEAAAKTDPDNYNLYHQIGLAWLALERYEKAASYFDAASELAPDYAPAWERKAWALGLMGRYEAALECADRALALEADDPDAWNTKGKVLLLKGDARAARECFDRALARYPSSAEALLSRATTYFAEGRYDDARPYFEELSGAGGHPFYLLYLYLVDRGEGRPGTGRLEPLLEPPADTWPKNVALFLAGRISAEDLLAEAAGDKERLCEAHFFIGYENKLDGDAAGARRHFEEAVGTGQVDAAEYCLARYELQRSGAAATR
jgi:tetratricopeptide (TPR) repeat protein